VIVYGEAARPRVIIDGFNKNHPFAAVVERYAGTVRYLVEDPDVRWESWDAVVSLGSPHLPSHSSGHLRLLQIGGSPSGMFRRNPGQTIFAPLKHTDRVGDELVVPDDLPDDELRDLVKAELLPLVVGASADDRRYRISPQEVFDEGRFNLPLLQDLDGYAYATLYRPHMGPGECLYLPDLLTNLAPWLLYAFKRWAGEQPDVFPSQPEWTLDPTWMTPAEMAAQQDANDKRAEAERARVTCEAAVAEAEAALQKARESADEEERLLLTGTDTPLADIVHRTLEMFGFEVTNVDESLAEGQAKKEDLRVADSAWLALCEVKGYSKGARLLDLQKLNGYATLYAAEAGKPPSAMWYVVNQFRGTDPNSRPQVLQGGDEYVDAFGQQGGLVIDTRDLFRLRKAVEAGRLSKEAAREMLVVSSGRFELRKGAVEPAH
jgi:hypothetical protein